jgi:hypothetical protein
MLTADLLTQVTRLYGAPRIATLPETGLDRDHTASFDALRRHVEGAGVVLFPSIAPGNLDGFFHLRLAQVLSWQPPLPAVSIVVLSPDPGGPRLASGFTARFRSGWPFAQSVFVTSADPAPHAAQLGLPVLRIEDIPPTPNPLRSEATASQKIALQFQPILGRSGSTTGFENQIESLVGAGFLTIRLFTDLVQRHGATLNARMEQIIAENSDNAGAHINALALPSGPYVSIRTKDPDVYWATRLAETALCRPRDSSVTEAANRADSVIANYLENVGPAIALAPRARLLLEIRDDRARGTRELMLRDGRSEADILIAEAAAARAQAGVLAIPDICGHVSIAEFERLAPHSRRGAVLLPRPYVTAPDRQPQRFDVLVFGDAHVLNVTSVRWFLDEVWRPHLAAHGVSVAIAGRVGQQVQDSCRDAPLLSVLGFVDDLDAVRSASRLTVVPDRQGTGTAVKTLATLAAGHPLVSTSTGMRGLDPSVSGMFPVHDDPAALAADILALLRDPDCLRARRHLVEQVQKAIHRGPDHAALLRSVPRPAQSVRAERLAQWARVTAAAIQQEPNSYYFVPGTSFAMSGGAWDRTVLLDGWHGPEPWGRWTDGAQASLRVTLAAPVTEPLTLELDIAPSPVGAALSLTIDETSLPERQPIRGTNAWHIPSGATLGKTSFVVTLSVSRTICPAHSGASSDNRILGIGVSAVRLQRNT